MENIRKQIEIILDELKKQGVSRREIEKLLNKSENYVDQILSKGGNNKFLNELNRLKKSIAQDNSKLYKTVEENKALIDLLVMEIIKLRAKVYEIPIRIAEEQFRQDVDLTLSELEKKV
jgi:arsenate reductase-like glutaredoxin family protein